jgi:large subunit ribosomal protein L29
MTFPKIKDARELSDEEVQAQILGVKRELFNLRLKQATRQPVKPHEFKFAKHRLGQLMTVEHERKTQVSHSMEAKSMELKSVVAEIDENEGG